MGALVRLDTDRQQVAVPFSSRVMKRMTGRQSSVGALSRSYLVTPAVLDRCRATTPSHVSQPATGTFWVSPAPSRTIHYAPPKRHHAPAQLLTENCRTLHAS